MEDMEDMEGMEGMDDMMCTPRMVRKNINGCGDYKPDPEFKMLQVDHGMEAFLEQLEVDDIEDVKNMPFKDLVEGLGDCDKCAKMARKGKSEYCMKLNGFLGSKIQMARIIGKAFKENNMDCQGMMPVLEDIFDAFMEKKIQQAIKHWF